MKYWKRISQDGTTTTVESYSHNLDIKGAIEIAKQEFNDFIASLPIVEPKPARDYGKEIDEIKAEIKKLKK